MVNSSSGTEECLGEGDCMENDRKTKGTDKGEGERQYEEKTRDGDGIVPITAASSFWAKLLYQLILF